MTSTRAFNYYSSIARDCWTGTRPCVRRAARRAVSAARIPSATANRTVTIAPGTESVVDTHRHAGMSAARRALDPVAREAKRLGFVARSAFKLLEVDAKFGVLSRLPRDGARVLDLGCAPGAWMQVVHKVANRSTRVVGIDLTAVDVEGLRGVDSARARTLERDIREVSVDDVGGVHSFDVVLSDMMASTTGIASVDATASLDLAECAFALSLGDNAREGALKLDGSLVVKIFEGGGSVEELTAASKGRFEKVSFFKPKATRSESKEIYLVCRKRRT